MLGSIFGLIQNNDRRLDISDSINHENFINPNTAASKFAVSVYSIDDGTTSPSKGNLNARFDAGETIHLRLQLQNLGLNPLTDVYACLNSTSGFVEISSYSCNQSYLTLNAGESRPSASYYVITANSSTPINTSIPFSLNITSNDESWLENFSLTVYEQANPQFSRYQIISEIGGDLPAKSNYIFDVGEEDGFRIFLKNNSTVKINSATLSLTISYEGITIISGSDSEGKTNANNEISYDFKIRIAGNIDDKAQIIGALSLVDEFNTVWNLSFSFIINGTPVYSILSSNFQEVDGNSDLNIDAGEKWKLEMNIQNIGTAAGKNVDFMLSPYSFSKSIQKLLFDSYSYYYYSDNSFTWDYDSFHLFENKTKVLEITFWDGLAANTPYELNIFANDSRNITQNMTIPITIAKKPIIEVTQVYFIETWGDDDSKLESDEKWEIELEITNIGGGIAHELWFVIYCDDRYIEWDSEDSSNRNTTGYILINNIIVDDYYNWDFEIASNTPTNHKVNFVIQYGFRGSNEAVNFTFQYTLNPKPGLTIGNWTPDLNLILFFIGLIAYRLLNAGKIRQKISFGFSRFLKFALFLFMIVNLGIFIYGLWPPYSLIILIPTLYFFFICFALNKKFRWSSRWSSREPLMTRFYHNLRDKIKRSRDNRIRKKNERIARQVEEKAKAEAAKETLPNLIHLTEDAIVKASVAQDNHDFEKARQMWLVAKEKTEKAIKKALDNTDPEKGKSKLQQNLDNIKLNYGLTYVNHGFLLKTQGKSKVSNQAFGEGASLYDDASKNIQRAIEYFKMQSTLISGLPENLALPVLIEKASKYSNYAKFFTIKNSMVTLNQEIEKMKKLGQEKSNIIDARKRALDLLERTTTLKNQIDPTNDPFQIIIELQKMIEEIRNFQHSLDTSLDSMLGIVKVSTLILDPDDDIVPKMSDNPIISANKSGALNILREYEFMGGKIRFKIKLSNQTGEVLTNLKLTLDLPIALKWIGHEPAFTRKGDTIEIPKLGLSEETTISIYLSPINCVNSAVNASLTYFDARDTPHALAMSPKMIRISCPLFFTPEEANIARVKSMNVQLPNHDRKMLPLLDNILFETQVQIGMEVVSKHDVKYVDRSDHLGFVELWYYGITKVNNRKMVIYLQYNQEDKIQLIEVAGENQENITALLAELENQIRDSLDRNSPLSAKDNYYDIKTSVILGHCPYCYEPIPKGNINNYQNGKSVECTFCKCQIVYYE